MLKQAKVLFHHENNKNLVQIIFTDHKLVQQFTGELYRIDISNLGMKDEPRKPNVTVGKDGKEDEYIIILSADEYNVVMNDDNAYAKLVSSQSQQPSFRP